jgi:hypothetical protein
MILHGQVGMNSYRNLQCKGLYVTKFGYVKINNVATFGWSVVWVKKYANNGILHGHIIACGVATFPTTVVVMPVQ